MLTTQDIIRDVKYYLKSIWDYKFIVLIGAFLICALYTYKLMKRPPLYIAEKTFMVSDDDGGGSGLASILGQIGLTGSPGGNYNYNKIIEIGSSNLIIDQMLFDSAVLDNKSDYIANHIIRVYNLHKIWKSDTLLNEFVFTPSNIDTRKGKIVRKVLQDRVKGNKKIPSSSRFVRFGYSEESTIISITGETISPELSIMLAERTYDKLSKFYIDKSIERQLTTFKQLEAKADSIYGLLVGSESAAASSSDYNLGLVLEKDRLPFARSMRNIELYGAMYAEILKNKETAAFVLNSQTPFFQSIDSPFAPLGNANKYSILSSIISFVAGFFIAAILVMIYAYYKKEIKPIV